MSIRYRLLIQLAAALLLLTANSLVAGSARADTGLSISPTSAPEGSAGFTLTVNGSGFDTHSQVVWTMNNASTTLDRLTQSGTQLTAAVPDSLLANNEGTATIWVSNVAGSSATFTVTEADQFTLTPQAVTAATGHAFSGVIATLTDTYDNPFPGELEVSIDWGDGNPGYGSLTRTGPGTYNVKGSHIYTSLHWPTSIKTLTSLPAATIAVVDSGTTHFTMPGSIVVFTTDGYQIVTCTGETGGSQASFTGCTGGTGIANVDNPITQAFRGVTVTVTDPAPGTAAATTTDPLTVNDGVTYTPQLGPISVSEAAWYIPESSLSSFGTSIFPSSQDYQLLVTAGGYSWWYAVKTSVTTYGLSADYFDGGDVSLFPDEGQMPYTETLYPNNGVAVASGSSTLTVNDATMSAVLDANTYTAVEGSSTGTIQVGRFFDPVMFDHHDDFAITLHWGDGASDAVPAVYTGDIPLAIYSISGAHTYAEEGTYNVTYDIQERGGSQLPGLPGPTVVVSDPGVVALPVGDLVVTGGSSPVLATFTDPGGAEANDGAHYAAEIAWGGTYGTSAGTISLSGEEFTVSGPIPYTQAGTYHPIVTISHEDTTVWQVRDTVTINAAPLTIAAASANVKYGDPAPPITPLYSGFVGSDSAASSVLTAPACSTTYAQGSPVSGSPYSTNCLGAVLSADYYPVYVSGNVVMGKADQTLTFGPLPGKTYGDQDFAVSASASSGLAVTFTVGADGRCTVSGSMVHLSGAGSCTIMAHQAGDLSYNAAQDMSQTFSIAKASQTINFGRLANKVYGDADFGVSAGASSGLPVSFGATGNCTVMADGSTVHATGAGSCTLTAHQHGDNNFNGAPDVQQSFTIAKADQSITFGALVDHIYGDADLALNATATSGLPVSYTAGASDNCAVTGNLVDISGAGVCHLTAHQPGDLNYNPAADVAQSFNIANANQTITFGSLAGKTYGNADFAVSASDSSGLAVSFSAAGNCTITGSTVHMTGANSCTITASQPGNANYNAAPDVIQTFNIAQAVLTVTADGFTRLLHAPNPNFTFQITGFTNNETAAVLTTPPTCASPATTASAVGTYSINCSGAAAANYSFTYVAGTLTVIYRFDGFLQPINDTDHSQTCGSPCPVSIFKGGSTVPAKFQLKDANGAIVQAGQALVWLTPQMGGSTAAAIDESTYADQASSGSSFAWDGSQYQYNWGTKGFKAGCYWRIGVQLDDGQTYYVYIGLR